MPPKSSVAAGPPRRTLRTTARKSIPTHKVPAKSTAAKSSLESPTPSSTVTTTTPETPSPSLASPPKATPLKSPKHKTTPKSTPKTTPKATPLASPATAANVLASKLSAENVNVEASIASNTTPGPQPPSLSSPKVTPLTSPEHKSIPKSSPKTISLPSPENAANKFVAKSSAEDVREEAHSVAVPSETNPSVNVETTGKMGAVETLVEKVSPALDNVSENVAIETAQEGGTKTGVKTVVKKKKTVRVVKRVVKKKVPKRVLKVEGVSPNNQSEKLDEVKVANPNPKPIESVSMEVDNATPNDSVSIEIENSKSNVTVLMDTENSGSNPSVLVSMEAEKGSSDVDVSMKVENPKEFQVCEGEKDASSIQNLLEVPFSDSVGDKNEGDEGEINVSVAETQLEDQIQNVVFAGDQIDEKRTENVNSGSSEGEEGVKEKAENSGEVGGLKAEVRLSDGVRLSGEMEALERRRRRKTEIFIGGLDKDAKEEDIRRIFEEIGEVIEVRLVINGKTGKNKGFAFVRYASAADAKKALAKYPKVEISGKQCGTALVEGNDTIFLGNIDKKWKSEDVVKLLQEIGIEKIDQVTVMADPNNVECNRGFAFLELETNKDAQNAYNKLQKKDVFGKHMKIKVAWAEPLTEPDEEAMLKVKSVYAEYIPSSWDEEKVRDYFKKFGEIENVALARNLHSSRRKDFAFVNYTTREAALACIEAFSHEQLNDEGSKVKVKVSLAKPIPRGKQIKHVSSSMSVELSKEKLKAVQSVIKPHEPGNKGKATSSNYQDTRVGGRSSTTSELVQLLREQASWRQTQPGLGRGSVDLDYPYPSPGNKRPFSVLVDDPHFSDPRGYPRMRLDSYYPLSPSALSLSVNRTSLPHHHRQGAGYTSESYYGVGDYPSYFQTRERAPYHGSSGLYRRY